MSEKKTSEKLKQFLSHDWFIKLEPFFDSIAMENIINYLTIKKNSGKIIYPKQSDIFNAFKYCSFENTKVVIIGQDPYHGKGEADGLAFSSGLPEFCPPSLRNILKEVERDVYAEFCLPRITNYSLKNWAEQGVLLLNSSLTVEHNDANSHKGLWTSFLLETIKILNEEKEGLVFLLWGKDAQRLKAYVNEKKHYVLECAHPSPLAAGATPSFAGCGHFTKTNLILQTNNQKTIEW